MDNDLKRRAFLTSIIGILIGAPVATRFLLHQEPNETHYFSSQLKKYRKQLDVPIISTETPASVSLTLQPPAQAEWNYLLFSPSYFPTELSRATIGEPDTFLVREGRLYLGRTPDGKSLIGGGDSLSQICSPIGKEEKPAKSTLLLCENGQLQPAKPKGKAALSPPDMQMLHLLGLDLPQQKKLILGTRWRSGIGRVKPFTGYSTDYEVTGFADIAGRKTVDIAFSGTISNPVSLPDQTPTDKKTAKDPIVTNLHRGHAWFDLENGFLVRQETEFECSMNGLAGYLSHDGSDRIAVKIESILHFFPVS